MEIPTAISLEALSALKEGAQPEPEAPIKAKEDYTPEEIWDLAVKYQDEMYEEFRSPLMHKVMALACLKRLGIWHEDTAEKLIERKDTETGLAWAKDAGILRSAYQLLSEVDLGSQDVWSRGEGES